MKISTYEKINAEQISQLFLQVFSDSEGQEEGLLIESLVSDLMKSTDNQDIYGFVAIANDQIVGSIFFTRLIFENEVNAFILSPLAVQTYHQRSSVGQNLINFGINHLKQMGVELVFTYGDPSYYCKTGFKSISENTARAPVRMTQPEGWLCQSLVGDEIKPIAGNSRCVDALNKPEYW